MEEVPATIRPDRVRDFYDSKEGWERWPAEERFAFF
jgi:hypothetical protein